MNKYFYRTFIEDDRGFFVKPYGEDIPFQCEEVFTTLSKKGAARGLHYQYSDELHLGASRVMTVISGSILDFIVRFDPTSKRVIAIQQQTLGPCHQKNSLLIEGNGEYCHGFIALENSVCIYASSQRYLKGEDFGFNLLSLKVDFEEVKKNIGIKDFIRSERDRSFPSFVESHSI